LSHIIFPYILYTGLSCLKNGIFTTKNLGHMMMYVQICTSVCCLMLHVLVISQEFEKCCKLYITLVHKGYRIVCSTVHLHSYDSLYKVNSIMNNAMYLRTASQCVSILHSVTETMTFWYKKIWQSLYHHTDLWDRIQLLQVWWYRSFQWENFLKTLKKALYKRVYN
jgi:hypothetical protein